MPGIATVVKDCFSIDARSIALFRVLLAATVVVDLCDRMRDCRAHYSDYGILPRRVLLELRPDDWYFSLHFINGSTWFQAAIFATAVVAALLLMVGYRSRYCAALLWLLVISTQFRNPFVTEGFDVYARTLLFWAMCLPLGAAFSIERSAPRDRDREPVRIFSAGTVAVLTQVVVVYAFTGLHKLRHEAWRQGFALQYALASPFYGRSLGRALLAFPTLLRVACWSTLAIELAAPVLFLLPVGRRFVRPFMVASLVLLHLGILLFMDVGLFSQLSIAALALFLPSEFWELNNVQRAENAIRTRLGAIHGLARHVEAVEAGRPAPAATGRLQAALVLTVLGYVIWFNVATLPDPKKIPNQPAAVRELALLLRLNQEWSMFADSGILSAIVPVGQFADGRELNLFDGSPLADTNPETYRSHVPGHRWTKFAISLSIRPEVRTAYAKYACERWTDTGDPSRSLHTVRLAVIDPHGAASFIFAHQCAR